MTTAPDEVLEEGPGEGHEGYEEEPEEHEGHKGQQRHEVHEGPSEELEEPHHGLGGVPAEATAALAWDIPPEQHQQPQQYVGRYCSPLCGPQCDDHIPEIINTARQYYAVATHPFAVLPSALPSSSSSTPAQPPPAPSNPAVPPYTHQHGARRRAAWAVGYAQPASSVSEAAGERRRRWRQDRRVRSGNIRSPASILYEYRPWGARERRELWELTQLRYRSLRVASIRLNRSVYDCTEELSRMMDEAATGPVRGARPLHLPRYPPQQMPPPPPPPLFSAAPSPPQPRPSDGLGGYPGTSEPRYHAELPVRSASVRSSSYSPAPSGSSDAAGSGDQHETQGTAQHTTKDTNKYGDPSTSHNTAKPTTRHATQDGAHGGASNDDDGSGPSDHEPGDSDANMDVDDDSDDDDPPRGFPCTHVNCSWNPPYFDYVFRLMRHERIAHNLDRGYLCIVPDCQLGMSRYTTHEMMESHIRDFHTLQLVGNLEQRYQIESLFRALPRRLVEELVVEFEAEFPQDEDGHNLDANDGDGNE